jgi:hypothetical protein
MDAVPIIRATTPSATDIHPMESVKGVSLCTLFTFTRRSPKEELKIRTSSVCELPQIVKNTKPTMRSQALKLELNHELFTDNSALSFRPPRRNARCPRFAGTDQ